MPHGLTNGNLSALDVTLDTGGSIRTSKTATNTALLQAYNTNTAAYTTFGTLTANNPPTFDLSASTTVNGNPIVKSSISPYIVGTTGSSDFSTIPAAIAQALTDGASNSTPVNIYIKPGIYSDNFTIYPGINYIGFDESTGSMYALNPTVTISGNLTCLDTTISCTFQNINLAPASGDLFVIPASTEITCQIINCSLNLASGYVINQTDVSTGIFTFANSYLNSSLFTMAAVTSASLNFTFNDCYVNELGSTSTTGMFPVCNLNFTSCNINSFSVDMSSSTGATFNIYVSACKFNVGEPLGILAADGGSQNSFIGSVFINDGVDIITLAAGTSLLCYNCQFLTFPTGGSGDVQLFGCSSQGNFYVSQSLVLGSPVAGSGPSFTFFTGDPNGLIPANVGSILSNTTPTGPTDRLWINIDGGTTWTYVPTFL
jgi:hypothetical protein